MLPEAAALGCLVPVVQALLHRDRQVPMAALLEAAGLQMRAIPQTLQEAAQAGAGQAETTQVRILLGRLRLVQVVAALALGH